MSLKIKEEVKKQFDVGFLAMAQYPEWVANIVPVPKKDGKVQICMEIEVVATYPFCGRARRGSQVCLPKEENARSRHQRLLKGKH